ncbi:TPA: hypothetical protein ACHW3Q_004927, partial [Escherichia coli]
LFKPEGIHNKTIKCEIHHSKELFVYNIMKISQYSLTRTVGHIKLNIFMLNGSIREVISE